MTIHVRCLDQCLTESKRSGDTSCCSYLGVKNLVRFLTVRLDLYSEGQGRIFALETVVLSLAGDGNQEGRG